MSARTKFLLPLFFIIVFGLVVWLTQPPESLSSATTTQFAVFFTPLLLFLVSLINLYTKSLPRSFILSLGIILILVLKALNFFIFFSIPAVSVITLLIARFVKRPSGRQTGSTQKPFPSKSKIQPKPHLLKFPENKPESPPPKIPKLSRIKNP